MQPFFVAVDVCFLSPKHCTRPFGRNKRNNSAPNKPTMCERRSLGLFRQMRRRTALRIARPLREPAMLRAGCALANVRRAARRARPTRLTSTHKWCVQQRSIARQRVRASHQPLHPILPFSFQTVHNLFFLLRRQRRAMRTRSGSQRAHRRSRVVPVAMERVWAAAAALAPAAGGSAARRGVARLGSAPLACQLSLSFSPHLCSSSHSAAGVWARCAAFVGRRLTSNLA